MSEERSWNPYQDVLQDLVRSIMRAQLEVLTWPGGAEEPVPDGLINRHFAWLTRAYGVGVNRHLFSATDGNKPIRVEALRAFRTLPKPVQEALDRRESLPFSPTEMQEDKVLVQPGPTRISQLVKRSVERPLAKRSAELQRSRDWTSTPVQVKSALSVASDFLTVPDMPGTGAYVLMGVRNFLFETFSQYPAGLAELAENLTFTVAEIEEGLSHIWTSMRPRYFSSGDDKLPKETRLASGGMLRQYLAARGLFWLRFKGALECERYLQLGLIRGEESSFEFSRSEFLDHLPDLGELVNELWGIPIPIRGGDTIFRGGLKSAGRGGLVVGIHGGPGSGKTSLALALGAYLSPFGISTLFLSGEETEDDLKAKVEALLPDELRRRLSFFPVQVGDWLDIQPFTLDPEEDLLSSIEQKFQKIRDALTASANVVGNTPSAPKPCRAIIVLDGLHDLLMSACTTDDGHAGRLAIVGRLRQFITTCRELKALVILTTGEDWEGDKALDYLVDVSIRLSHDALEQYGKKPNRRLTLTKARHQLCAVGTHGIQIAGKKGVRFSPQINYQLDRRSIWRTRLPEMSTARPVLRRSLLPSEYAKLGQDTSRFPPGIQFTYSDDQVLLPKGSNIFLNGEGSSGKAALALKIAASPTFDIQGLHADADKILVVSFLYPEEYYVNILNRLMRIRKYEYPEIVDDVRATVQVIHLYPGDYGPDYLFNRIEWALDAAELEGQPFTAVVIDGIHNVFLQFPEIERYSLFWPQLFAALRSRPVTIISTHTTFVMQGHADSEDYRLDDRRSEPLRHSLVQKTDFRIEVDPLSEFEALHGIGPKDRAGSNIFAIRTESAINQTIPDRPIFWSRERLVFVQFGQGELPFGAGPRKRRR